MIGKKTTLFVLLTFAFLFIGLGFGSAVTESFYPTSGYDTTGSGTYYLTSSDLAKVASSDNAMYESYGRWPGDINAEEIVWKFSPSIDSNAILSNAKLTFEWQRGWFMEDTARIWIWDESQNDWGATIWLNNPSVNEDITEIRDLSSYINSAEDVNNLEIKFQAVDGHNPNYRKTNHDLVKLTVTYDLPDTTPPTCELDYIKNKVSDNEYYFSSHIYTNEPGNYYLFGSAEDSESAISSVQYNRTSPNDDWIWDSAVAVDGDFNELTETWDTDFNDNAFIEGEHTICCRVTDDAGNGPDGTENCDIICVDSIAPEVPEVTFDNPSECVPNYINEAPEFSWTDLSETDEGCAPIIYDIEVYFSDGTLDYTVDGTSEVSMTIAEPENGQDYYIRVRARDLAGNVGEWSENSTHVYYDTEAPSVEITGMPWDADENNGYAWYNDDFNVYESDTDNLGVWKVEYKVHIRGGEDIVDWTEIEPNGNFSVLVPEQCNESGLNTCWVYKRAIDYACNEEETHKEYDIDTLPPVTTKTVSEPRYPGRLFNWIGISWDLDWFVRDDTTFTLTCNDQNMSGCDETYYRLNYNNEGWGNWTVYEGPFTLANDGIYEVEYYSVDNVGNVEETNYEVDKVDTQAPTTTKTEDPLYEVETNYNFDGEPAYTVAGEDSVLIWKVGDTWKLRWTDDWSDHIWSKVRVRIITETPITNFQKYSYENDCEGNHPDCLEYEEGSQMIIADTWVDSGEDGIEFSQEDPNGMVTFEIYYDGILSTERVFLGENRVHPETNPFSVPKNRWVSGDTIFIISAEDSEVGVNSIEYSIDEEEFNYDYNNTRFTLGNYCEDGYINHEIEYTSSDLLGNYDDLKKQLVSVDCLPPEITILNPNYEQEENKCSLSVVSQIWDTLSGVNSSTVKVELLNSTGDVVRTKYLASNFESFFSGVIDLDGLAAGDYTVRISAEDNVGNTAYSEVPITLLPGVTVEQVTGDCSINAGEAKTCTFNFQVCSRDSSAVSLWISKLYSIQDGERVLLDVIDPFTLNSTISNEQGSSSVGLSEDGRHPQTLEPLNLVGGCASLQLRVWLAAWSCPSWNGWKGGLCHTG